MILSIAGHVSRAMLSRYSHVRMETKGRALDEIAAHQSAADEKRKDDTERRDQATAVSQSALVQQKWLQASLTRFATATRAFYWTTVWRSRPRIGAEITRHSRALTPHAPPEANRRTKDHAYPQQNQTARFWYRCNAARLNASLG